MLYSPKHQGRTSIYGITRFALVREEFYSKQVNQFFWFNPDFLGFEEFLLSWIWIRPCPAPSPGYNQIRMDCNWLNCRCQCWQEPQLIHMSYRWRSRKEKGWGSRKEKEDKEDQGEIHWRWGAKQDQADLDAKPRWHLQWGLIGLEHKTNWFRLFAGICRVL